MRFHNTCGEGRHQRLERNGLREIEKHDFVELLRGGQEIPFHAFCQKILRFRCELEPQPFAAVFEPPRQLSRPHRPYERHDPGLVQCLEPGAGTLPWLEASGAQ